MVVHSLVCHSAENGNHVAVPHANYSMLPGHRIVIVRIGCLHKMLDASLLKCLHHPRGATERHKERIKSSTLSVFQFSQAACAFLFSWYFFLISQMHLSHIFRFCMRHFHYSKDVIVALKLRCTSTADHIICMNHSFNVIFTATKTIINNQPTSAKMWPCEKKYTEPRFRPILW